MKQARNIYEYVSYINLLNDNYLLKSTHNPSYSLRAYARDLGLSVSFLSKIMNRKNHLSIEKGVQIFEKVGYRDAELDYLKHMIIYNTSEDNHSREISFAHLKKHSSHLRYQNKPEKDKVLETLEHFLVYTMVKHFDNERTIIAMLESIGFSPISITSILQELIDHDYLKRESDCIHVTDNEYMLIEHDDLHHFHKKFSLFVLDKIIERKELNSLTSKGNGSVIKADSKALKEINETICYCVRKIFTIADQVKEPSHLLFFSNSLSAFPIPFDLTDRSTEESLKIP